jgi:hypothetical protein
MVVTKVTVRHKGVLIESTEYKQLHKVNKIHTNLLVEKNRIPTVKIKLLACARHELEKKTFTQQNCDNLKIYVH